METMASHPFADIAGLADAFERIEVEARTLLAGLTDDSGTWRPAAASWSVAECLDHLATANRVYLAAMRPAAEHALANGRRRRRPALPGIVGRWFVRSLEPPPRWTSKLRSPKAIRPRPAPALSDASTQFLASHADVRAFLERFSGIDLAGVRFPNPFIPGVRFSLATGLHVIAAHERRHLWQASRVRAAAEAARRGA